MTDIHDENEIAINNINEYNFVKENFKLNKLMYVTKLILFNTYDKIILFSAYIFLEFLLLISKYVDIYLFYTLLDKGISKITNNIAIYYLANRFATSTISGNSKTLIKYISTKYIFEHEMLIQQKLNILDIDTIHKLDKWKIIEYPLMHIPDFIKSFTNITNIFFLCFEFIFITSFLLAYSYNLEATVVIIGFVFLLIINLYKFFKLNKFLNKFNNNYFKLFELIDEKYSNIEYLKSADLLLIDTNHNRFKNKYNGILKYSYLIFFKNLLFSFGLNAVSVCMFSSIFILGLFQENVNVYVFIYTLYLIIDPLDSYLFTFINNLTNISYICGLYDFFHLKNDDDLHHESIKIFDIESSDSNLPHEINNIESIEFNNVCKKIKDRTILSNISFKITSGMKLGIVGDSGSGKSTIDKLILKMTNPTSGEILFNGINSKKILFENIRDNVIYISQEPKLFNLSLKENLLFESNKPKDVITFEYLQEMLKRINLNVHPDRLNEEIGFFGNKYSGGQKQKINILRGLLKDASVIILDEPTSALDVVSECAVMEFIYESCKDKIMIIIAHRLNTIKNVDYILVMKEGKIAEEGTHEGLIEKNEIYKKMIDKFYETK